MVKHKCFISFKTEDMDYKGYLQNVLGKEWMIDKSLNTPIDSEDEDYIMRKIREDYLSDSTVTIMLIGTHSAEISYDDQKYIKREMQASLYNGIGNTRNGILGVVLPDMYDKVFQGTYQCATCNYVHTKIILNDTVVIKEFSYNYYLPNPAGSCCWHEDDRYCVLVKWDDFISSPYEFIQKAFDKRTANAANKVKVRP